MNQWSESIYLLRCNQNQNYFEMMRWFPFKKPSLRYLDWKLFSKLNLLYEVFGYDMLFCVGVVTTIDLCCVFSKFSLDTLILVSRYCCRLFYLRPFTSCSSFSCCCCRRDGKFFFYMAWRESAVCKFSFCGILTRW